MYLKRTMIMTRERSEEEKRRRHLHGDRGAKFSKGKVPRLAPPLVIGTITTMITKDILIAEIYEDDNHRQSGGAGERMEEPTAGDSLFNGGGQSVA